MYSLLIVFLVNEIDHLLDLLQFAGADLHHVDAVFHVDIHFFFAIFFCSFFSALRCSVPRENSSKVKQRQVSVSVTGGRWNKVQKTPQLIIFLVFYKCLI